MVNSVEYSTLKNFIEDKKSAVEDDNSQILQDSDLQSECVLSEAEVKFLSLSKEKKSSKEIIDSILNSKLTLENYEQIFCLKNYQAEECIKVSENFTRSILYRDKRGGIVAIIHIDEVNKKILMRNLGGILPKQEYFTPYQVGTKLQNLAKFKKWTTEDGGENQFNGNLERRYKDFRGNVMAAIITKSNGVYDTVAEYEYLKGVRTKMLLTNYYGQSVVVYDGTKSVNQVTRMELDTDGTIIEVTKIFEQ